ENRFSSNKMRERICREINNRFQILILRAFAITSDPQFPWSPLSDCGSACTGGTATIPSFWGHL
ncbi:hypothetical protein P4322_34145, partial [Bacillus thuringiensis]|nr:hypothetical protein [Bacillus thuringiensis]